MEEGVVSTKLGLWVSLPIILHPPLIQYSYLGSSYPNRGNIFTGDSRGTGEDGSVLCDLSTGRYLFLRPGVVFDTGDHEVRSWRVRGPDTHYIKTTESRWVRYYQTVSSWLLNSVIYTLLVPGNEKGEYKQEFGIECKLKSKDRETRDDISLRT